MAIAFAYPRFIQRSKGHNAVHVAAYNMRDRLDCERTGERTPLRGDPATLVHHEIMLPEGASDRLAEAAALWNAAQAAEHRKDSQEAFEVVLPLPANREITSEDRLELARSFANEHFVSKGLAAQLDLHSPHAGDRDSATANHHSHILVTTRRIEGDELSSRKATGVFPKIRRLPFGKPVVAEGELWGPLWRDHQNTFFGNHAKGITVDPVAPMPQVHLGPKRFRHPQDQRIAANDRIRDMNAKITHTPETGAVSRESLEKTAWADKNAIGLKKTVEDVARELSPEYARHIKEIKHQQGKANYADRKLNELDIHKLAAEYRQGQRWEEMGITRRVAHIIGSRVKKVSAMADVELERWANEGGRSEWLIQALSIRREAALGKLNEASRLAAAALETIRPQAEAELHRRHTDAQNAREALDKMTRNDNLMARSRRTHSHAATL